MVTWFSANSARRLHAGLREAGRGEYALVRNVLERGALAALTREVEAIPFIYARADDPEARLGVFESYWTSSPPAVQGMATALYEQVLKSGVVEFARWSPNTIDMLQYMPGHPGLEPHPDGDTGRVLSAMLTVTGSAPFCFHKSVEDLTVLDEWVVAPGDLVLMRCPARGAMGWDMGPLPVHSAGRPQRGKPRIVILIRMSIV